MSENEEYVKARERIIDLEGEKDVVLARATAKIREIETAYDKNVARLTKRKNNLLEAIEGEKVGDVGKIEATIKELHQSLEAMEGKIHFLRVKDIVESTNVEINRALIKPREGTQIIWLKDLRKEKYLHIVLCIAQNRKPKNKFSLVAYGKCALAQFMPVTRLYADVLVNDHECRCDLTYVIKEMPTVEELQAWAKKHWTSILYALLLVYDETKKEYEEVISKHTLKDFEPALTICEVSEEEAPIVCKLTEFDKTSVLRIYKRFYYRQVEAEKVEGDVFSYIKVSGMTYVRLCRIELMGIEQSSNVIFGDWCSINVKEGTPNERTLFNKENYERAIKKIRRWLKKEFSPEHLAKVRFSYPKVEWIRPDLLPHFV